MPTRAMWKAELAAGRIRLPVKLYAAVEDRDIHFHFLHDQDMTRVEQRLAHSRTGETVPFDQARRGLQIDSESIVILDEDDLETLEPPASREIKVEGFLPRGEIAHLWYERPYYLGPDDSEEDYFALADALASADRDGVARWVMRGKEYVGALVEQDGYLMLVTLRHEEEVIDVDQLDAPSGRELPAKEQKLAEQLVRTLHDDFDPTAYQDSYREQVAEMVAAKARGETWEAEDYEEPEESESLADSLAASLEAMQG